MTVHDRGRTVRRGIALVGLRAAGKTTLGAALGVRLGWPVLDTDAAVAERVGQPVGAFLASEGEDRFRAEELPVCREALAAIGDARIVSLGGGAVLHSGVRSLLIQSEWLAVWVDAADEILEARMSTSEVERPRLGARSVGGEIRKMRRTREALYRQVADLRLETDDANVDACTARVLAMM